MNEREKRIFSMTKLEEQLKFCIGKWPEIMDRILTGEELARYISWMATNYGAGRVYQIREGIVQKLKNSKMQDYGEKILESPTDSQLLYSLSENFRQSREENSFDAGYDIAVGNMLRYMPAHWHQNTYFEVYYCFSGACPVYFSNETIRMKPGTIVIIAPGAIHATPCYSDDAVLYYYMLRSSTFDKVFWNQIPSENLLAGFFRQALSGAQPNSYLHFETEDDPELRDIFIKIYEEFMGDGLYNAQLMNAYMSTCFVLLLRRYEGSAHLPRSEKFYWKHEYSAILSDIQSHFANVKLSELAGRYHYSEKQIRRIVQSSTGENYTELLTRLRMERAVRLMRQTGMTLNEIATDIGYSTVNSFYRAFTGYYGCPPRKYLIGK